MNLEDHLGDILRKARGMTAIGPYAAAKAGGLSEAELAELEASGTAPGETDFAGLARAVGLDGRKLEGVAKGWTPLEKDLSQWRELRKIETTDGGMAVNCYLVWDEVSRDAALFDTGWDASPVFEIIAQNALQLRHVFITHGHEDHVAALDAVRERFPKVRVHSGSRNAPVDQRNRATDFIHLGSLRITNRETPGHAEDGVTYIVGTWPEDAPHVAIVGDAIFAGSMGRGNISWDLAKQKVKEQILSLPTDTLICPGHGPLTTVGEEREHNPFF